MRVLFLVPYPTEGPSNRLRVEQYLPSLDKAGVEYQVRSFVSPSLYRILYQPGHTFAKGVRFLQGTLARGMDLVSSRRWDVVFVHREAWPLGTAVLEEGFARMVGGMIFDFDDSVFLPNQSEANSRLAMIKRPQKTAEIIKASDFVIAGNEYLKDYAIQYNGRISVIPTPVDTDRYSPCSSEKQHSKIVIGWIGTHSTARYLHSLDNVFKVLTSKYPNLEIVVVSNAAYLTGVPNVRNIVWNLDAEREILSSLDIGVMPMPDDAWTRGKCGFKALLYMSMAMPVVCSPVGVNAEIVSDGVTGFAAVSEEQWVEKLSLLIEDAALRRSLGNRGRQVAEENYSVKVWAPRFVQVLIEVGAAAKRKRSLGRTEPRKLQDVNVKQRTAESFGYEWERFNVSPLEMEANFWGYFQFFSKDFFAGKRVLDAGSGMGRHSYFLAKYAADLVALDISDRAIQITAGNVGSLGNVICIQADIETLPLENESFDFISSIGVLHHLPDPEADFQELVRRLKPGGTILVYLYQALEHAPAWVQYLLAVATFLRRFTTRLPYTLLERLAWFVAAVGYVSFSLPYRYLSRWSPTKGFAETLPLKRYAVDGFRICYNDQFDRLSAPIENRYTYAQVQGWFQRAGLKDVRIEPHYGWIASGRK